MESNNDEKMCGICYQSFNELHPSHSANCEKLNHLYHSNCLKCWYNRLREMPNIYDADNIIVNKPACPLCSDKNNTFVDKNFWIIMSDFHFENTIKKESETYTYRLNTILLEEIGELITHQQLFDIVRTNKTLLYGYKIIEYKCNPSQQSYIYYKGPKMFKKNQSFIFEENSFKDTYINDTGDFALSATINRNITEYESNKDIYVLVQPNIINETISYFKLINFIIIIITLYYLIYLKYNKPFVYLSAFQM